MPRLTITLSTERRRALKETAARRGKTIGQLTEESLDLAGIATTGAAREVVEQARGHSGRTEARAIVLALKETRPARRRK